MLHIHRRGGRLQLLPPGRRQVSSYALSIASTPSYVCPPLSQPAISSTLQEIAGLIDVLETVARPTSASSSSKDCYHLSQLSPTEGLIYRCLLRRVSNHQTLFMPLMIALLVLAKEQTLLILDRPTRSPTYTLLESFPETSSSS